MPDPAMVRDDSAMTRAGTMGDAACLRRHAFAASPQQSRTDIEIRGGIHHRQMTSMPGADACTGYQDLRNAYDALVAAYDQLLRHHGIFLLRQLADTRRPDPVALSCRLAGLAGLAAHHLTRRNTAAARATPTALTGGAYYYAHHLHERLQALQHQMVQLTDLAAALAASLSTIGLAGTQDAAAELARAQRGPIPTQMLRESQCLLTSAQAQIMPLIAHLLPAVATPEDDIAVVGGPTPARKSAVSTRNMAMPMKTMRAETC